MKNYHPPKTFHKSPFVLDPDQLNHKLRESSNPELAQEIRQLFSQTRYRTAMDILLKVLAKEPKNYLFLYLASMTLSIDRTEQLRAKEPITESQYYNSLLDPIFVTCSSCGFVEVVRVELYSYGGVSSIAPSFYQCYDCGYVMCRSCITEDAQTCINCSSNNIQTRPYPTGRNCRQQKQVDQPILCVILFREGPLPPSSSDIESILRIINPDALEDGAELIGIPVDEWPDVDSNELVNIILKDIQINYGMNNLPLDSSNTTVSTFSAQGLRYAVAKQTLPAEETITMANTLRKYIEQAITEIPVDHQVEIVKALLEQSIQGSLLKNTIQMIANLSWQAAKNDDVRFLYTPTNDFNLCVLVIPSLRPIGVFRGDMAETVFDHPKQYLSDRGVDPDEKHLILWYVYTDGIDNQIIFNFLPNSKELPVILGVGLPIKDEININTEIGYLYWFHRSSLTETGYTDYQQLIFQNLLFPLMASSFLENSKVFLFDGDIESTQGTTFVQLDEDEGNCMRAIQSHGVDTCYVLGIFSDLGLLQNIHETFTSWGIPGYLGKISCPGLSLEDFIKLTSKMNLNFTANLDGSMFRKGSFDFLTDEELKELGFSVSEMEY